MKIRIIQGRLLPPIDGFIQEFPIENWKNEFEILKKSLYLQTQTRRL